ncbi:hypothetical protein M409DRAFT_56286 [Zasmidium cellare ATCC 36951]|uniref:Wax synthase domain-containing protein n=1 Tax=Zasmidium cellare ATCC 36951 TaxID=1080233 RepID=A0A6A6CCM2_ZASCE|nr:uncharacterized protein M409DRAFT_56286 [Zasmidium cellare ATCC 36951]KAF2164934.1 hypothetical protein M409DRAFT_56286 [Zasmidium cellare ATCC 36951]
MNEYQISIIPSLLFVVVVSFPAAALGRHIIQFSILFASSIFLSVLGVYSLSLITTKASGPASRSKGSLKKIDQPKKWYDLSLEWKTRVFGIVAAAYVLALPYFAPGGPLAECVARAILFACAGKILDLTVARAHKPPKMMERGKAVPVTDRNRRQYVWLLLRECRYHSFDIATSEKERDRPASTIWTFGPGIIVPLLVYFVPCSETRFLLVLLIIHAGMETGHTILHPSSPHPLFWQPFAAGSISSFWRTHWQQDAASFLYSLAYAPAKEVVGRRFGKQAGRVAGVMAAFNLSGIWHGWAAACVSTAPWRTGAGMWALFVAHGVLCLVESAVWKDRQGGLVQRILVWAFAIWSTGMWIRDTEERVDVPWLKEYLV